MDVKLTDLNHRLLIEKVQEDLRALESNMNILYEEGSDKLPKYTDAIIQIAENIEKLNDSAYSQALHEKIISPGGYSEPRKSTTASEIFKRYE